MNVILLENINGLGKLGAEIKVRAGYARNYLLPQEKAVLANTINKAIFEKRRSELEKIEANKLVAANSRIQALKELPLLTISARASKEGNLYGSISTTKIVQALSELGCEVNKREIILPEGSLNSVGNFTIEIKLQNLDPIEIPISINAST